ncbi:MAG TPA: class I SAM-dependent methyltransferase [Pyrinomonadaceae bacterium]|jgi:2-polyprenyl-3-methyl-5-hydroxy-6-metoxy-1,4-benzoquinol methylase|nr:class I SAM-dependent methyltransferase [Pyrinomonadaceae bacterium]
MTQAEKSLEMAGGHAAVEHATGGQAAGGAGAYRWVAQRCPVCDLEPTKYVGRRGGAAHRAGLGVECHIWRCGKCDLIFPNPMPVPVGGMNQHYSGEADDYFKNHDSDVKEDIYLTLIRQGEALVGGKGRLLDIGAGRGEFLRVAQREGWTTTGIEPSDSFAAYAERYTGAEIRRQPVEECGFAPASFDLVNLGGVLEHLYNPDETIREIARVLRPGGALFVDVPNEMGLYFRVGNLYQKLRLRRWSVNLSPTFDPYHVFGFNAKSLRALLAKHELRVAELRFYSGGSVLPALGGMTGALEQWASDLILKASRRGGLGLQVEAWAVKT